MKKIFLVLALVLACAGASWASELYPGPAYYDFRTLASYTNPLIASGAALPPVASASIGDLYLLLAVGEPSLWRREDNGGATWTQMIGGGGGGGGTTDHSALSNLGYDDAGHTGFASEVALATVTADLSAHTGDTTDPHGAAPTFSEGVTLGSGTADVSFTALGTGTVQIASYVVLLPITATPSAEIATGTLWVDANQSPPVLKFFDGTSWQSLH